MLNQKIQNKVAPVGGNWQAVTEKTFNSKMLSNSIVFMGPDKDDIV